MKRDGKNRAKMSNRYVISSSYQRHIYSILCVFLFDYCKRNVCCLFARSLWIIFKELHDGSLTIQSSEIAQSVRIICAKLFRMHTHLSRKLNKVVLFFGTRGLKRQNFISFASFRSVCLAKQNQRNTQNNINNKNVYYTYGAVSAI